jgi:predicted MFS family arabinose efflux permease
MLMPVTAAAPPFVRDRLTWLTYFINAWGTYSVAAFSPLMAFLALDLGLNYTERGLHTSSFAIGTILAGVLTDQAARRFSRRLLLWVGGTGLAGGLLILLIAGTPVVTIAAAFFMGLLGTTMFVMGQAALADHQSARRSVAFSESSVGASLAGFLAPILISVSESLAFGWRLAVLFSPLSWLALFAWGRGIRLPVGQQGAHSTSGGRLPKLYWVFWGMMFLGAAVEWSVSFWTPEFLNKVVGVDTVTAAGALSLFWLALIIGRVVGSVLARRFQPVTLLLGATALVALSFPVLWLARDPALAFIALFVMSLGLANFFPFMLSTATAAGANNINAATARVALANGLAILIAPQLLGSLGDQIGIGAAFSVIGLLAVAVFVLGVFARWAQNRTDWRTAHA